MSADDRERWRRRARDLAETTDESSAACDELGEEIFQFALEVAAEAREEAAKTVERMERGFLEDGALLAAAKNIRALSAPPSGQQEQPGAAPVAQWQSARSVDPEVEGSSPSGGRPAVSPQRQQPGVPTHGASSPGRGDADFQALPAVSPRPQAAYPCKIGLHHSCAFDDCACECHCGAENLRGSSVRPQAAEAETRCSVPGCAVTDIYKLYMRKDGKLICKTHQNERAERTKREAEAEVLERAIEIVRERDGSPYAVTTMCTLVELLRSAPPAAESAEPDVFAEVAGEHHMSRDCAEDLAALLRERFGGALSYTKTMAARPCVTPGKDCGWCDSCEARNSLRARAEAGGTDR